MTSARDSRNITHITRMKNATVMCGLQREDELVDRRSPAAGARKTLRSAKRKSARMRVLASMWTRYSRGT